MPYLICSWICSPNSSLSCTRKSPGLIMLVHLAQHQKTTQGKGVQFNLACYHAMHARLACHELLKCILPQLCSTANVNASLIRHAWTLPKPASVWTHSVFMCSKVSSGAYFQHACHGQLRVKISVSPRLLRMTRILAGSAAPDDCVPSALAAPWDSHTTSVQPPALGGGRGIIRRPICKLKESKL